MYRYLLLTILLLSVVAFFTGRATAMHFPLAPGARAHSVPNYHGAFVAIWVGGPALILVLLWLALRGSVIDGMLLRALPEALTAGHGAARTDLLLAEIHIVAAGKMVLAPRPEIAAAAEQLNRWTGIARIAMVVVVLATMLLGAFVARARLTPRFRARVRVEAMLSGFMVLCALLAVLATLAIVVSLAYEAWAFFQFVSPREFFLGLKWEPQIALRADQIAGVGAFGAVPLFVGTLLIATIAMAVAVPIGLYSAIYLVEYASDRLRGVVKPALEILAGVPTVVYGFFAVLTVAPAVTRAGSALGIATSPNSALAAGAVMGVMIIPFISSLSDDALRAVPRDLRDGSLAMGATRAETMIHVLLPAALPGIMGGVLLGFSRAIGETMIVVMAAGLIASMTFNPLASVTTVTVQIVTMLVGDTEFNSPKTLAAFALGLVLFVATLCINIVALAITRRYRAHYE